MNELDEDLERLLEDIRNTNDVSKLDEAFTMVEQLQNAAATLHRALRDRLNELESR